MRGQLKSCEATLFRADGVVRSAKTFRPLHLAELTTPSAPTKEVSQHLVNVASTPPLRGGECCSIQFIHGFINRRYSEFSAGR